jgi:pimeloyl-ACP methyl ester carboxylesterase
LEYRLLQYKNSVISWRLFGNGPQAVVCFHGYGEESGLFSFLENYAGKVFTFYAIDLPFHGKTEWNDGLLFSSPDLLQIVQAIVPKGNQKPETRNYKLIILGFSLGGRMALSLYEAMPAETAKMVLLAPDGLKVNFWYWLSTQTSLGMSLFSFTMKHPGWFFGLLKSMNKLGLMNASVFRFVKYYIDNAHVRELLYNRWVCLRKIKPSLKKIKNQIRINNTSVRLVYGQHDRIILPSVGKKFQKGINGYCTLTIIPSGHQVLHEKHAEDIMQALQE